MTKLTLEADPTNLRFASESARATQDQEKLRRAAEEAAAKQARDNEQAGRAEGILKGMPGKMLAEAKKGLNRATVMKLIKNVDYDPHGIDAYLKAAERDGQRAQDAFLIGAAALVAASIKDAGFKAELEFDAVDMPTLLIEMVVTW